jgi:aminoglycoside phosphotransferase (APT) family kinase protein
MCEADAPHELEALARTIEPHCTLLRSWTLPGGVSAQVTALELETADGRTEKLVMRRHGAADLQRNPNLAADEFRLLQLLHGAGLPVPPPRHLSTPYLVVDFVEGEPGPAVAHEPGFVTRFAAALADIHRFDCSNADVSFLPGRVLAPGNPSVLLHGDFWPGNTLWQDDRLAAVLDWEDAARGDPLADVANARLELLWLLGADAMEAFTRHYEALMPDVDLAGLPHWDLLADERLAGRIADWGLDEATETAMRAAHEAFVAQAQAVLGARLRSA